MDLEKYMRDKRCKMPGKIYFIFFVCTVAILVGGCPFQGLVYEEDLVGGYAVWAADVMEDASIVLKDKKGSGALDVVPRTVFAYGWNDEFIIAKQHPEKKGRKMDKSITYWYIVEVASGTVHGPLSEDEFNKLRTELKVPPELSFKTIQ
jgi:hypothetical protein